VSLAPNITEIIFALGRKHLLKGVTTFSDFPVEAKKIYRVGSYVKLDLERIVSLNPDLCIAVKDGNPKAIIDRLESLGIPVYAVDPKSLDGLMHTIFEVGELLNAGNRAKTLVHNMRLRIQRIKLLVAKAESTPRVFWQIGISPIISAGPDTFINELITLAGGKNIAHGTSLYPRFSREQVLSLAPDVFIITSMEKGMVFDKLKADWGLWPEMPAVRNNRIFLVDSNLFDRPTPRLVDGLEHLERRIHPELFGP
jgi:iron complex transport system substrate-binding protein